MATELPPLDSNPATESTVKAVDEDTKVLHSMGYAQELLRGMRTFQNFAISFSIICILVGGLTSFGQGLSSVGGASIGLGWPLATCVSLLFALAMGQIGSAYPTAGGLYHWGSILGGRAVGWVTAWCNLIGLITVLAAVNVGSYLFIVGALGPFLHLNMDLILPKDPTFTSILIQTAVVTTTTLSQALINHLGIKLTSRLIDFSGYLIFFTAIALAIVLFAYAPHMDPSRLWTFKNYSGDPGGGVWPKTGNMTYLFLLGLLLPAFTITGFDASAHTAEETIGASKAIPKGMIHSVLWSGIFGWIMLAAIVLAAPNLDKAAGQGGNSFVWIMTEVVPQPLRIGLFVLIGISQYLCGLATVTSASRMMFAFARDGGLPWSKILRRVSHRYRTPVPAIWVASILTIGFTIYTPVYTTIAAVCAIFIYVSYLLPVAAGLVGFRTRWTQKGPFDLKGWYPIVAVVCTIGCIVLIYVGVQPPNDQALKVIIGSAVAGLVCWFGLERKRFAGPPIGETILRKQAEIAKVEEDIGH